MSGRAERDEPIWMKWHDESIPIRVGVSACLLGGEVRFDGGHKRDRYLTDVLGENVLWLPVCPEIEVGMGIPRPVIQLRDGVATAAAARAAEIQAGCGDQGGVDGETGHAEFVVGTFHVTDGKTDGAA